MSDARDSVRLREFPLFVPVGAEARADAAHPDFARLPASLPIVRLGLAAPTVRALRSAGIKTVGDLILTPSSEVATILRGAGRTRLRGVRDRVAELVEAHLADPVGVSVHDDADSLQLPLDAKGDIGDATGYVVGDEWDRTCPTCWSPAESTDFVTIDDEEIHKCTACGEYFYIVSTDEEDDEASSENADEAVDARAQDTILDEPAAVAGVSMAEAGVRPAGRGRRPQGDRISSQTTPSYIRTRGASARQGTRSTAVRERAASLFRFLREVVQLRTTSVRSVAQYERDGRVIWLADVPRERGCACAAWPGDEAPGDDSVWLEITRPELEPYPTLPEVLRPWLERSNLADSDLAYPDLRESVPAALAEAVDDGNGEDGRLIGFDQAEGVFDAWSQYVEHRWQPWAAKNRRLRLVQDLYNDLFSIHQTLQSRGDEFELVVGLGLLQWRLGAHEVKRHLLTTSAELTFESDRDRGRIVVGPPPEGVVLRLEQEMLEVGDRPDPEQVATITPDLDRVSGDIWHGDEVRAILRRWVNSVSPDGHFVDEPAPRPGATDEPTAVWAPALVLRKRTSRPLLDFYENVIGLLEVGEECPDGVAALVEVGDESNRREDEAAAVEPEDVYFPLPANEEQLQILRRLNRSTGVLVQGPPGTGKSHTIANLIAHLLATGQRVLVTSQTPRALRVLRDKLPPEIADLCVLLLGDDRAAMGDLDRSVQAITERYNHWDLDDNLIKVKEIEKRLDGARRRVESRRAELLALRESEVDQFRPLGGAYSGSLASIARRLRDEQGALGWLVLSGEGDPNAESCLTDDEAMELLGLTRSLTNEREELADQALPPLEDLPSADDFEAWAEELTTARAACQDALEDSDDQLIEQLKGAEEASLRSLSTAALAYNRSLSAARSDPDALLSKIVGDMLSGRDAKWTSLTKAVETGLTRLDELGPAATGRSVSGVEDHDLLQVRHDADALRAHLRSGGTLGTFLHRAAAVKQAKYIIEGVRVDGGAADCEEVLSQLSDWLEASVLLDRLDADWRGRRDVESGSLSQRAAEYRDLAAELRRAMELHDAAADLRSGLQDAGGDDRIDWLDSRAIAGLARDVSVAIDCINIAALEARFQAFAISLQGHARRHEQRTLLNRAIASIRSADTAAFRAVRAAIVEATQVREEMERRSLSLERFRQAAEHSANELLATFDQPTWDDRMREFGRAWAWAQADRWLECSLSPGALERVTAQLQKDEDDTRAILNELAATRAWGHCLGSMTASERMHLVAWSKAVRKIGKGTGKYATRYRREAQENMDKCRSAIPAWVMPTYRVAETIRPGQDSFDVVIVDEASQSGLDSLFLHYLGAKLIVVGDDQQISPDHVGVNLQDVEDLRRQYIPDIPLSTTFGVGTSLFDQAQIRFGNRVRLREHFRCMPEIIEFCNQLQYKGEPLVPLRQFASGRLEPIVLRHVHDGYQESKGSSAVNRPEAEALVDAVEACCCDPRYADATMGVISLLGEAQASLIERQLLTRLGPEEMEERHLTCGDAYSFQGDERDIIFLTMVSAPNARIGTLADDRARRRFNVAVSRAKDQLWLFHTATPRDLSPTCVRRALLEYCANPTQWRTVADSSMTLGGLQQVRLQATRRDDQPPAPFDSWFEIDVFLAIASRGYRVAPQYEVAGYHIDMVVEGAGGRLAVECDGDEVHGGIEKFEADMVRQRRLERCDWSFWRVGGGEYYRNPERALEDLWRTLERLGIRPASIEDEGENKPPVWPSTPDKEASSVPMGTTAAQKAVDPTASPDDMETTSQPAPIGRDPGPPIDASGGDPSPDPASGSGGGRHLSTPAEPEPQSWDEYEDGVDARMLPDLDDSPVTLPFATTEASKSSREPMPSVETAGGAVPGWLSHGVLGNLAADTVPELSAYRVAKPAVDTFGLHLSQVPQASLAEIIVRVVQVESPVLVGDVASRVARCVGLGKVRHATEKALRAPRTTQLAIACWCSRAMSCGATTMRSPLSGIAVPAPARFASPIRCLPQNWNGLSTVSCGRLGRFAAGTRRGRPRCSWASTARLSRSAPE